MIAFVVFARREILKCVAVGNERLEKRERGYDGSFNG